jgi:hypothetical protein
MMLLDATSDEKTVTSELGAVELELATDPF